MNSQERGLERALMGYPWFDQAEAHRQELLREAGAQREDLPRHHLELRRSRQSRQASRAGSRAPLARLRRRLRVALGAYLFGLALVACIAPAGHEQPAQAAAPAISNGRVAFAINIDDNVDVYSVLPDGTGLQRLTEAPEFDACPAYSPDGEWIAWCGGDQRIGSSGSVEIWLMRQDGSEKRQLTHSGGRMLFPAFSPDGERIVFSGRLTTAASGRDDLWVIGRDGSGLAQLTSPGNNLFPAWSPDGRSIVFLSDRTGLSQVWVMQADGSEQHQLTFDAATKGQVPRWRPDGAQIAYAVSAGTTVPGGDIWLMNADGSDQHPIATGEPNEYGPAWAPDGTQVAYLNGATRHVEVMTLDGSARRALYPAGLQFVPAWQARHRQD